MEHQEPSSYMMSLVGIQCKWPKIGWLPYRIMHLLTSTSASWVTRQTCSNRSRCHIVKANSLKMKMDSTISLRRVRKREQVFKSCSSIWLRKSAHDMLKYQLLGDVALRNQSHLTLRITRDVQKRWKYREKHRSAPAQFFDSKDCVRSIWQEILH